MSDIFREVEEEVRRDRFDQLWKQYGDYVVAAMALLVIAIAGYELYGRYEDNQHLKASETLLTAQQLADSGETAQAGQALAVVSKDAPRGYAEMARMTEAGVLLAGGKRDEAIEIYKSIAADDSGPMGRAALIRAGWAMVDVAPVADVQTLLAPVDDPKSPWRHAAREILAYADYHAGKTDGARALFDALAKDKDAPDGIRQRATAMAAFLKEGGLRDFGSVPLPPKPTPASTPPAPTPPAPTGSPK